jgi:16S rRNA (uracil1498-N3)-methyltransferase
MRAHFLRPLEIAPEYVLRDEGLHHLVNVVRIAVGEPLLLLDGEGLFVETVVEAIHKRELQLRQTTVYRRERTYHFDLVLGMPKRDALELCLREATELGFQTVYLVRSEYSQMRMPEAERLEKLLVASAEQANAPYLPRLREARWEEVPWENYGDVLLLDSQTDSAAAAPPAPERPRLLVVGPEGGFTPAELAYLHQRPRLRRLRLPTPILRTPTAVATGAGILIQSLLK